MAKRSDRPSRAAAEADVTGHRHALESLRKFSRVIEQTASTVVITDSDGVIEYVNPRFCQSSGYAASEAIGRRPNLLKSGQVSPKLYEDLWRTITGGGVWRGEFHNRRKDGSLYWQSAIISPVRDDSGLVTHFVGIQDDITAAKQADAALRASETRFRQLFDLAPVPLCYISRDGLLVDFNRRFVETFGYTLEDVPTLNEWWQLAFADPDSRREAMARWASAVRCATETGDDIAPAEYRVICKNGEARTMMMSGRILNDHIFVTFFDISERKQAERLLAERAAEQRAVVETTADGFWMVDESGRILAVNDAYAMRSGYRREELLQMNVSQLDALETGNDVRRHLARVRSQGSDLFETRHRTKAGDLWPVEVNASYWASAGGRYFAFLRDIGAREQAEQALRESEEKLRLAVEGAGMGMWDWSIASGELHLSPRCATILSLQPEPPTSFEAFVGTVEAADRQRIRTAVERALGQRIDFDAEYRVYDADGALRWVAARGRGVYSTDGTPIRMVGIVLDIDERKRSEAAIQRLRVEMERRTRLLVASQTVAALAHDLNQPLNAVAAYAEAALRLLRAGNPMPDRLEQALENSSAQAQRAGQVVRDLLAALQTGDIQLEPVDLNQLVSNAIAIVKADGQADFHTMLELASDLPRVSANRLQIEKVVVNLIQNGVEAMREASVDPKLITIAARTAADGRMAHVTVSDRGPGLDDQALQRVFDPFFTTKASGLGMGLTISRAIIEAHGGQLWSEPNPGIGASFHFTLPFVQ